jgi:hypothetical protein
MPPRQVEFITSRHKIVGGIDRPATAKDSPTRFWRESFQMKANGAKTDGVQLRQALERLFTPTGAIP